MLDSMTLAPSVRRTLQLAAETYAPNLDMAADFLSARGITREAASSYQLGVVSNPLPGHDRFVGMLSIPYITRAGVVALKFRALDPERTPKYDAPSGQHSRLYNVNALHSPGDTVAICEGELDALVMSEVVGIPAVGVPGASHWQEHWSRVFADYETILVIADHDAKEDGSDPGLKHAKKVVSKIAGARLVLPPAGCDLTEWVQRDGVDAVRNGCGL
ncbi:MAG: hypothetical protein JWN22_1255 [Nocardioides sp.]|nr:hypothetical protein [Nocardioides sp.]